MRYYKVKVATRDKDFNPARADELVDLYEQLGRRAVVAAESVRRSYGWWDDDENEPKVFPVFVFAADARSTATDAEKLARAACEVWGLKEVVGAWATEATYSDSAINGVSWYGVGRQSILQKGNLFELYDFTNSTRVFKDWIVERRPDRSSCLEAARGTAYGPALEHEARRVFEGEGEAADGAAYPIPVHYLVEGSERADHRNAVEGLLELLLLAGRLPSPHAIHLNFDNVRMHRIRNVVGDEGMAHAINEALGSALEGNVLVVEYGRHDRDGAYDEVAYRDYCNFIELMASRLDTTLVVLSMPSGNPDLMRRARKLIGAPVVEISPEASANARLMSRDEAMAALGELAVQEGFEPDGRLTEMLDERLEDASFSDLEGLFDDWRREKLISERFPEYGAEMRASLELRDMRDPGAMAQLDELIGLDEVKRQVKDILARFRMNREAERQGLPVQTFSMHMAFLGAPGTGKTEVARLYGQIMKEAGILSEGRVVSISGSDLCRSNVEDVFDRARGSVLFVDEAYSMRGAPVAIAELIAHMEDRRDDTVVILAGYDEDMDALLDSNPGFRSRLGFTLRFPEYDEDELLQIFKLMCRRARLKLPGDARRAARDLLSRNGRRPDQGNARYVRKLFEDSVGAQQVRLARRQEAGNGAPTAEQLGTLLARDIEEAGDLSREEMSAHEELEGLIGLGEVKRLVSERIDFMRMQKLRRDADLPAGSVPMHMAFLGAPGTGKTEVARLMGRILRDEGVLSVGDFYECTGASLNVPMSGASEAKVRSLFQKARGSVVFIDEAYSMLQHANGADNEAVSALIAEMENHRDEVVVILAGYEREIEELLASNPGFGSRVRAKIGFPDYSPDELTDIFCHMTGKQQLEVGEGAREKVRDILEQAAREKGFGNARFARNLLENALLRQSTRLARLDGKPSAEQLRELLPEDIEWNAPMQKAPVGFAA